LSRAAVVEVPKTKVQAAAAVVVFGLVRPQWEPVHTPSLLALVA
jgi:hypothetical protein